MNDDLNAKLAEICQWNEEGDIYDNLAKAIDYIHNGESWYKSHDILQYVLFKLALLYDIHLQAKYAKRTETANQTDIGLWW